MRIWRTILAAGILSLITCLFAGTVVFAEKVGGELTEGCTWEMDTETGTLTLTGTEMPSMTPQEIESKENWLKYEKEIKKVCFNGFPLVRRLPGTAHVRLFAGWYGTITWELDIDQRTLSADGTGAVTEAPWCALYDVADTYRNPFDVVVGDQITSMRFDYVMNSLKIGASYLGEYYYGESTRSVTASPDNPYVSTYDGAVYTKGFEKLLYFPAREPQAEFHPNVKIIGAGAFRYEMPDTVVIPWGVTTIEERAFSCPGGRPTVVLPNTVTSMLQESAGGKDCSLIFTYAKANTIVDNAVGGKADAFSQPISNVLDSLAQYYPNVPEAQGPGPGDKPGGAESSAPSSQPESKPESSAPASKPESKPESSAPASKPESKPAESSASSQPPESKPVPESSAQSSESASVPESSQVSEDSSLESSSITESSSEESLVESAGESSESGESSATDLPSLPTVEKEVGGKLLWIVLAVVLIAGAGVGVVFLLKRKK